MLFRIICLFAFPSKLKDQILLCLFVWVTKFSEKALSTVHLHTAWNKSSEQGVNCLIYLSGVLMSKSTADYWDINIFSYFVADHLGRDFEFVFSSCPKQLPFPSQVPKISAAQHHPAAKIFSSLLTVAMRIFQYTIFQFWKFKKWYNLRLYLLSKHLIKGILHWPD